MMFFVFFFFFFFQAEDGIRDWSVTGVQTCALPITVARRQGASGSQLAVRRKTNAATVIWQPLAAWRLEICTQADLHMPRRCGREPALHRRARRRGVLGEGAERVDAPVEQIPYRATQLEVAPGQRERQISDGMIGEATGDVQLDCGEPLRHDR